jgi:hypothetical protein
MKRSDNTEMDRLLRRHARLSGEALRASHDESATISGAHLDADELNAYAEGALNEAARSRYFAHLADCDTCRKLVTDLTLAASVSIEGRARAAVAEATPSRSWKDWLGAIFSPPVLRYGVPALVLFAVIIVAFIATRTNRESSSVAQRNEGTVKYAPTVESNSNSVADSTTATGTVGSHSNSNAATLEEQKSAAPLSAAATPPPASSPAMDADTSPATQAGAPKPAPAQADDAKTRGGEFGIVGKREQEQVAAAPPPPPVLSAPAATGADKSTVREEAKKNKLAEKDDDENAIIAGNTAGGVFTNKAEASQERRDVGRAATTRAAQNAPRNRPSTVSKSGPADSTMRNEDSAEPISVGGRRFRKQGGAWVDTAYNSSSPTTNVARGSEHYRTLVADEPALRTITRQLGGEVIVVWKSRAYRFY